MKKQKRTYSLTAKERKAKRAAAEKKKGSLIEPQNSEELSVEAQEQAMVVARKRSKRTTVIIGVTVGVAVLLILTAVLVPVILFAVNPYYGSKTVMARFDLSNGMELEFVIDESEYDTAATNFIFLAENKFFDNTVFYDAQNGWLRFGGYVAQPESNSSSDFSRTHHRKDSTEYCARFKALASSKFQRETYKFGYRLRADSKGTEQRLLNQEGVLAFLYSDTATEFQFSYRDQATNQVISLGSNGNQTTYDLVPTMVGHAYNDKTIENLKTIAATAKVNENISTGYQWRPPTPDIMIETVKIYNLDSAKWRDMDFIAYMNGNDSNGSRRLSSWVGSV